MPKKPLQDNVEREQFDLKSIARVKHRVGGCAKLPLEVRTKAASLLSEASRLIEDHGYGGVAHVNGAPKIVRNGSHARRG